MFAGCEKERRRAGGGAPNPEAHLQMHLFPKQSGCYSAHTDILTVIRENEDMSSREVTIKVISKGNCYKNTQGLVILNPKILNH